MQLWNDIKAWFARPFNSQMDVFQWTLFLGMVIVIVGLWNFVLLEIARNES